MNKFVKKYLFDFNQNLGDLYYKGCPRETLKDKPDAMGLLECFIPFTKERENSILETHIPFHITSFAHVLENQYNILNIPSDTLFNFYYNCRVNGFKHQSILPVYYYVKDNEAPNLFTSGKLPKQYKQMMLDKNYVISDTYKKRYSRNDFDEDLELLSPEQRVLMGTGMTKGFCFGDGITSHDQYFVELEDGNYILFLVLKWLNK